ncbi:MAG: HAD hydrolase-like protein [Anaerolineales bacterium]|nr:MAG: HAD hydrolase-like protein [Anaerolineales bacterium]
MTVKAILFDFDGVLVDSVNVKTEAFRELFSDEREHLQEVMDFHLANGGMSRFVKFEMIYHGILKKPLSAEQSKELGEKFSRLVMQKVIESTYMPGALEFIRKYSKQLPLFIASGTPQDELHEITSQRGLNSYFREIHGTPRGKPEIIRDILMRYAFETNEMPFIGDAINDYKASLETNSPFYGHVLSGDGGFPADVEIVRSFHELETRLFDE